MEMNEDVVPVPAPPADPRVAEALQSLAALAGAPLDEHPAVLEAVHDRLREILGEQSEEGAGR